MVGPMAGPMAGLTVGLMAVSRGGVALALQDGGGHALCGRFAEPASAARRA
jgi:hypothetical protein